MRSRFLKHSDVQIILQRLGLPLIDLAYGQPLQTIEEDDHESEHVVVPVEVVDVDAEPSVSTESTLQQFGAQLVAAAAAGDPGHGPGGGGGGDGVLCRVERMPKNKWGLGRLPQKDLCVMTETDFRNMTHARAAVVGAQACKSLAKTTHALAQLRKLKRQALAQVTKTSKQMKLAQDSQSQPQPSSLELVVAKSGKRLTSASILALGIRRNLTHIAAADVGALLLRDLSGSTVLRAEVRTGASVNACMKEFADNALAKLRAPPAADGDGGHDHAHVSDDDLADLSYSGEWHLVFISVRADATNSNIWRREKLHVCEAQMGLVCKSVTSYPVHAEDFLRTKRCMCQPQYRLLGYDYINKFLVLVVFVATLCVRSDLQVVTGSTAEHCAGIMQKQLNSIGVPSVADLLADMDTEKP